MSSNVAGAIDECDKRGKTHKERERDKQIEEEIENAK